MKLVKESLNEGHFSCTIDDLYEAVNKYIDTKLHYPKGYIKVSKNNDHVLVQVKSNTTQNTSWQNNSDEEILRKIKAQSESFMSYFKHFKNFCTSGLRGVGDLFRKEAGIVSVNSTAQLDKVKFIYKDKNSWRSDERKIYRYSDTGINDLGDAEQHIQRYGKENLDVLYITVGLFLKNIYEH